MTTMTATRTGELIHVHTTAGDVLLVTEPTQDAGHWAAALDRHAGPGEWAAVPPAGSDWERADWDALAHRAGVA